MASRRCSDGRNLLYDDRQGAGIHNRRPPCPPFGRFALANKKRSSSVAPPWPAVKGRAEKAIREGRFQQALDLAKQIHKADPTPGHLELLRQSYLGRARQLRTQGQTPDALSTLHAALAVDPTTRGWLHQIAEELARCGEVKQGARAAGSGAGRCRASSRHGRRG